MHVPLPSIPVPTCPRPPGGAPTPESHGPAPPEPLSLRALVREHARFVGRIAADAGVPAGDVDDVVQAVVLILWHHLERGGELPQAKAWLRTVTRRVSWAHNRAAQARGELPLGELPGEGVACPEDFVAPSVEEVHESMAAIHLVREIAAQLRPERRVVLVRYELDGEAVPDIAADLGISPNTAHSRLRRAREDFRRLLAARLRKDERRRAVLLPFFFQRSERPPSDQRRAAAGAVLCALLALLVLDTRWAALGTSPGDAPSFAVAAPQAPGLAPGEPDGPSAPARGSPDEPAPAQGSPDEPAPVAATARAAPATAPPRPAKKGASGSPRPADAATARPEEVTSSRPPRRRRSLETARILLDSAERTAAAGLVDAAEEALRSYSVHAPDDPMPATRAAIRIPDARSTTVGSRSVSTPAAPGSVLPAPVPPSPSAAPQPPPPR